MTKVKKRQLWEDRKTEPEVYSESGVRSKVADESLPLEDMRILWVDRDQLSSIDCRAMLELWGATLVVIEEASSGLDAAALARPDVVVISYDQGDTSGEQLARVLHFVIPDAPPVILVTKYDFRGHDGGLPGVFRVMPKPFHPQAMLKTLLKIRQA